ncbi:Crp/Fnr family transcriptional regulator [Actinoplanes sp. NPDC024001]|uniref:Crp/Fnr family transcriptional regulator n=1 Tax=Actinoplanes sp. NPDC024001 TaxID=3154598 RepID=UPI0033EBD728
MTLGHPREPFWYALSDSQRIALRDIATHRYYDPDTVICRENETSDFAIIVLDGCVKVSAHASHGYQAILGLRDAGALLGEQAGTDRCPRSATLTALTLVEALILPEPAFRAFLQRHPDVTAILQRTISGRLREADRHRAAAGGEPTPQRLAALLLDLGRRYGSRTASGAILIELPLSQEDLAGLVLTSHRTIGRILELWRERDYVVTGRRKILISAEDELRRIANGQTQMSR